MQIWVSAALSREFLLFLILMCSVEILYRDTFCCVLGRPEEQDDSENSTIYITGLTENATMDEVAEFFKQSGIIRVRGQSVTLKC